MDTELLTSKFERIGARVKVHPLDGGWNDRGRDIAINIRRDRKGEFFDIGINPAKPLDLSVVEVRPDQRHLLLMLRMVQQGGSEDATKQKFLCGHDERAWFVAAVPGRSVSSVSTAMEALKPMAARRSQVVNGVRPKHLNRRKNPGYVRQGEWFFIPQPSLTVDPARVLRREPLQRSGGKPHRAEFAYRAGGDTVYVSRKFPNGLTADEHLRIVKVDPSLRGTFRAMQRNATVHVKGRICHPTTRRSRCTTGTVWK